MYKKLLACLLLVGIAAHLSAQNVSLLREINSIKRNTIYFYSETLQETEDMARPVVLKSLVNQINAYVTEKKLPEERKVTEQTLKDVRFIRYNRRGMVSLFAYTKRSLYVPMPRIVHNTLPHFAAAAADTLPAVAVAVADTFPAVAAAVADTLPAVAAPEAASSASPLSILGHTADLSVVLPDTIRQAAVLRILQKTEMQGVAAVLNDLKAKRHIKGYGVYGDCPDKARCFWIILKDDAVHSLVTVLGPGISQRVNFKTLQPDALDNYFDGSNGAVWMEFAQ